MGRTKTGHHVDGAHPCRGGNPHHAWSVPPASSRLPAMGDEAFKEKWYTGRFSVPYFILIFANVKIKDESQSHSRDLTNRKRKTKQKHTRAHTHRVDRYCLETVTFELLRSNFWFDISIVPLRLMPSCFWIWHFCERGGGDNRESCWEPALAAWAFLWQPSVAGIGFFGFGGHSVWFGFSCPMRFMN